jgi:hypothetical protein
MIFRSLTSGPLGNNVSLFLLILITAPGKKSRDLASRASETITLKISHRIWRIRVAVTVVITGIINKMVVHLGLQVLLSVLEIMNVVM